MVSAQLMRLAEQHGYTILEKPSSDPRHYNFLVTHPDGTRHLGYNDFYSVQVAYELGEITPQTPAFDVDVSMSPFYPNQVGDQFDYCWDVQPPSGSGLFDPATWFLIALTCAIIFIGFITATMAVGEYILHPCQPNVQQLSNCMKLVTKANCEQEYVDICYDGDGDGVREGRVIDTGTDLIDIVKWIAIGAIAIGGVYIAAKVLPGLLSRRKSAATE